MMVGLIVVILAAVGAVLIGRTGWYRRNERWWWTFWAVLVGAQLAAGVDVPRWLAVPLVALYAFLAGWRWRERTAIRGLERMDRVTSRDLIVKAAGLEYVKLGDDLRGWARDTRRSERGER